MACFADLVAKSKPREATIMEIPLVRLCVEMAAKAEIALSGLTLLVL
jgi:hypothetical protein